MIDRLPSRWRTLAAEVFRFLMVGGLGYIVDVGLSNLLVYGFGPFGISALMSESPLKAKIVSTIASVIVAWLGNRLWTYSDRQVGSNLRGITLFFVVNAIGMVIAVLPLGVTWYLLGLRDPISYNISTNVVGIGLAMVFRFYAYRTWVFKKHPKAETIELDIIIPPTLDSPGRGDAAEFEEEAPVAGRGGDLRPGDDEPGSGASAAADRGTEDPARGSADWRTA